MAEQRGTILVAVDGESHTDEAVSWAIDLALGLGFAIKPVHVRDPYLKQFSTEIYAQGREEYLQHVQDCLEEKAETAEEAFECAVRQHLESSGRSRGSLSWSFDVLDGEPAKQIAELVDSGGFSMVVVGRRRRTRAAALRSPDLGERLSAVGCAVPLLVVPEAEDED